MAAFVTDQFRILNAGSFVESISNNSYYAFLGLSNPTATGFGRTSDWNTSSANNPTDNFQYRSHYRDTSLFGKKITTENARRVIRKIEWVENNSYDMYRHDYRSDNLSPKGKSARLYDSNYYVITSDFKVYVCIENGTSGIDPTVPNSSIEPTHTDPEPVKYSDGYRWKYLFSISPADVIKFDSTEYIVVPNDWETSSDYTVIREGGNSESNDNQIKAVYVENGGSGYTNGTQSGIKILGDGIGATASIDVTDGSITSVTVTNGGKGYTYGVLDLSETSGTGSKLIPIIPPSKGHGYDIYTELGTDKVLMYARFDDSTKDFPIDTKFSQVGIIKNPETFSSSTTGTGVTFTGNTFSSLYSIALTDSISVTVGDEITQTQNDGKVAKGYVASFDTETKILKYYQDRSLSFGNKTDQVHSNLSKNIVKFNTTDPLSIGTINPINGSVMILNSKQINLGVTFANGLANPEINKKTGDIIYIDNRPIVQRDSRQKEDVKIILEF
jgi:hypothetical protein